MKNGLDLGAVEISLGAGAKNVAQVHGEQAWQTSTALEENLERLTIEP